MKYIRKFATRAAYDAATIYEPSVSLIAESMGLVYNPLPLIPSTVTIGGIKWATCNVGATKPEEYGLYFQWGDTVGYTAEQVGSGEGKKYFSWGDYKYSDGGSSSNMTKYNLTDGLTTLELSDDAAHAAYGGTWRMPTSAEIQALGNAVNTAWTADYQGSGVTGLVCTDKTDNTKVLFFPAAGGCMNGSVSNVGSSGVYWNSSLYPNTVGAHHSGFNSDSSVYWDSVTDRRYGFPIRAILADPT